MIRKTYSIAESFDRDCSYSDMWGPCRDRQTYCITVMTERLSDGEWRRQYLRQFGMCRKHVLSSRKWRPMFGKEIEP